MLDVFGLGLVIVWVKLDELAATTLRTGFWAVLAAACLAQLDAWLFRRAVLARERFRTPRRTASFRARSG